MILACDALPHGIGAVLSHIGVDRPIAYASRTLTAAEKNYAQIEKEGLAIVFGTKSFIIINFVWETVLHRIRSPAIVISLQ